MATCGSFLSLYIWKLAAIVMIEKLIISPLMCPDISFVSFITLKIFLIVLSRNYFGNEVEHILEVRFRIRPASGYTSSACELTQFLRLYYCSM